MKIITFIFLAFMFFGTYGQTKTYSKKEIIGTWKGTKKSMQNGRDTLNNGKKMKNLFNLIFLVDNTVIDIDFPPDKFPEKKGIKFSIQGDKLRIGYGCYRIEKLTNDELVLVEQEKYSCNDDPIGFKLYFRKAENN